MTMRHPYLSRAGNATVIAQAIGLAATWNSASIAP
jgi:hypothetical protein